jgi:type II secretory ATPase GspE/PulE/Tfp pilus assembly ATPase PilB-like protein
MMIKVKDIPYVSAEDLPKVPFVLNGISSRFIRERKIIPLDMKNNILKVVMVNPEDTATVDALKVATSAKIMVYACDGKEVEEYISKFYEQETQNINRIIEDLGEKGIEFLKEEEEDIAI